ncbi:MAG: pantetheine-phosphate adenylyltransferase [Rhodospirillaceae bacterium]|nr:pantetheine-phosphate adenylyltransferase [Rhodospirillaceae bacterium]
MINHRVGVYPGSFDPITTGHIDIITRSQRMMDKLIVGVAINTGKSPLFSFDERMEMLRTELMDLPSGDGLAEIEVRPIEGLLVHFAKTCGASLIVRGLRAVSDFDYEFQMAGMNARMEKDVETMFLMASERHTFIASRLVKEVALLGGDYRSFVPERVGLRLADAVDRYRERKASAD